MKSYIRLTILAVFLQSAVQAQKPDEDIILKAMQDELGRNMAELTLPDLDKPFFMMYGLQDQRTYSIMATLGSITQSYDARQRFRTTTRVLVGDYAFNDESLEDNLFSPPTAREIGLPLDQDYFGIRRSFWSATDKVYRDAARHFQRHQETLKETGKALTDLPHRSFASSQPQTLLTSTTPQVFDKTGWEQKLRKLSALFLKHPAINNSTVILQNAEGYKYLVTSEGTLARVPANITTLAVVAQSKNADGEFTMKQIFHAARSADKLPTEQQLVVEIEKMIAEIEVSASTPKFNEEYSGPVLIVGPAVADVFSNILFGGRESIFAADNITPLTGFQFDTESISMDGKIGKSICHESMTVKARPKLTSYHGTDLLGSFEMDDEGIVPADELMIVERGVLRNLLNNRTLTHPSQTANGFSSGPGVIEVTVSQKNSEKELKEKLIAQARKEGLDYALIIRETPGFGFGLMNVYQVSVADGKEQLMRNALMNQVSLKTLKRVMGASEKYQAYNVGGGNLQDVGQSLGLTSFIVPEAILLEEIDIQPFRMPSLKEEEYVSNPLK